MQGLAIGEVARRSGVPAPTLRYYEQLGIIPPPRRVGGHRRYGANVLRVLNAVRIAKQAGFTLQEVKMMREGLARDIQREEWKALARRKLREVEKQIAQARMTKEFLEDSLRCDCDDVDRCTHLCAPLGDLVLART